MKIKGEDEIIEYFFSYYQKITSYKIQFKQNRVNILTVIGYGY